VDRPIDPLLEAGQVSLPAAWRSRPSRMACTPRSSAITWACAPWSRGTHRRQAHTASDARFRSHRNRL